MCAAALFSSLSLSGSTPGAAHTAAGAHAATR